jgi:hypothetical protein
MPPWRAAPVLALLAVAALGGERPADPTVEAALNDAAQRTGIAVARLRLVAVERVTWLDGSLGCPEPDLMYAQALVPGYRIRIDAGGKALDYHADLHGALLLCPPERAVPPAAAPRARN